VRVLLDSCVWGPAKSELDQLGHDVIWAGEWDRDPGDEEILARARDDDRVLVTLDKDFGELAVVREIPHRGIVRLVGFSARNQASICARILDSHETELNAGAIVTVEPHRVRIRPGARGQDSS
jgi:predicted nuclease of predicted toxin-antitoxin system